MGKDDTVIKSGVDMLTQIVELPAGALTGAHLGFEAGSFHVDEGDRPRIGQAFLIVDPGAPAGSDIFGERVETLCAAMQQAPEVRLPAARRHDLAQKVTCHSLQISDHRMQILRENGPKYQIPLVFWEGVTSGSQWGNNASMQVPFGGG